MRASSMQHTALQMSYTLRCRPYGRPSRRSDAPMTRNCERHVAAIAVSVAAIVPAIRPFTSTCSTLRPTTSQRGTRLFFEWLEDRFGGRLPMAKTTPENPQVVVAPQLTARDLQRLFRHEITVLQVRNFYPKASALQLGQELAEQALSQIHHRNDQHQRDSHILKNWKVSTARGLESSDVFTLGAHEPFNIAVSQGDDGIKEYFDKVSTEFRERRRHENDTTKPLWPLDQLRLELDEIWPHGAGLAKVTRRRGKRGDGDATDATWTMGGGLPRIMMGPTRWAKGFVHVDELAPLSMNSGLFSANIYLQLPSTKPHNHPNEEFPRKSDRQEVLEIWPLSIMNRWDWYRNARTLSYLSSQDAEGQVVLRRALGQRHSTDGEHESGSLRVAVEPGDLVLICAQRPHCAIGFDNVGSVRVSLQAFCQYEGKDKRLSLEG